MHKQNSPYHKLVRWLVDILDPTRKVPLSNCMNGSFEFANVLEKYFTGIPADISYQS